MNQTAENTETVRVVRNIAAPAEKVYEAFIDPGQLVRWIGPGGPGATRVESQPGVGGATDIWVIKDEGEKLHFHWEVTEQDPPNRLVLDFAFGHTAGPDEGEVSRLTVDLKETGAEETELTLTHDRLSPAIASNVSSGWKTITDRLADYLETTEPSN